MLHPLKYLTLVFLAPLLAHAAADAPAVLLHDDFSVYRAGLFSSVVGAHTEYHYLSEAAAKGPWAVSTFLSGVDTQRAWRIIETAGEAAMAQVHTTKQPHFHPMLVAGDSLWRDYTVTVRFAPLADAAQSGVAFRYRNARCYYFFGVHGQRAVLTMVQHGTGFRQPYEKVLDERAHAWTPGDTLEAVITVRGSSITARIDSTELHTEDQTYPQGKIALTSDVPTNYLSVAVTASASEAARVTRAITAREAEEAALQAANPQPVLWKRIDLGDFGVGRNVRFGDLNGDGQRDVLLGQVRHHGPKDRNSELSCLTAMTFDGERLWQIGEADPWNNHLTNDVAFQIHDIDGDGKNEVVYCMNMEIVVADGATGEAKYKAPTPSTPENTKAPYNKFPRILGDSIYFCDLRGTGRDADIIIKDRYQSLWALDDRLDLMWHAQCNTGHYPYAYDVDGDGKDELMMGYTLFGHDGQKLWSLDDHIKDHADGVAIVAFTPGAAPRLLCAASDEGLFFTDMQGNILKHHQVGHVQNPAIADFRPDLPGLEAVSINFWGNQGIVHFYDAHGDIYHDFEPVQHGSMCLPINWTGSPGEFWVLSPNVDDGGMFDGWGRRVVRFPADGHPDMCVAVLDITGDCRDEVVVWDPSEMWVYTQDDNPKPGRLYAPIRNGLHNESNYMASVSLPAWNDGNETEVASNVRYEAIDLSLFQDGIAHWQKKYGRDRDDARLEPAEIVAIAENILRYQNPDGGWPKDIDYLAVVEYDEVRRLRGHTLDRSTLDNHCTYPQVAYLAKVYQQTHQERYRDAAQRGLEFILREQRPTGGWRGADVDAITFNDDVMTGTMRLLLDIQQAAPHFDWLDSRCRARAAAALDKGIDATLACQILLNGAKTGWCQQHDHETFAPVKARTYELPSIGGRETADIIRFLMALPEPDQRIVDAIEAGVAWLRAAKITGIRVTNVPIDPVRFEHHTATFDRVVIDDEAAPPIWARFYELETGLPFFCGRDGIKVPTLAEVELERRTGYGWYGHWPARLLEHEYPAWALNTRSGLDCVLRTR
jgi:rhamnogalacturonan endolyase